ncbi:ATP-dependent 6-phosphofructokinase [Treponema phagedenis]|uniref:ATP-dependent 6-phosphofructokinase n=1 Tax=Treponema phagedenis TaxID=162 RepID=A0A0B7GZR3_TREPH|nr:ATP-dependent 6-phosphofructokinase [Treponema phagedenis]NVP24505.1 ATP-dependent 6-phosphofructokinase [Treponema phagedenis]QEJ95523.1 ATP-dependent 6-phosphofructokinase [Treponema phagedenis]QEJ97735.1 ATP-dependent 6-phosphofructokinase [Treponema phagedenis]QEK01377.1 ATP-dependent 6-phosphofructokinase [Treponema phagedenis]QEK03302.1 ATP-dependent 6-phosphofructokinase [Treponema phagedenis]
MNIDSLNFSIESLGECKIHSPIHLSNTSGDYIPNYVYDDQYIHYPLDSKINEAIGPFDRTKLLERAGPREKIFFNPNHVHAGIITCGGLCPGLNDVIRSIVRCLWRRYGVKRISGIKFGFKGLLYDYGFDILPLNPDVVDDCHRTGGSLLGTSRGGGNRVTDIVDGIERLNLHILFVIGGDGSQKGAKEIAEEIERRKLKIAVVGIPKTVDNDLSFIQKSFGFDTAVVKATEAVAAAHMEAHSQINGIGLVKLMGRESGFIATHTAIASHETNFVLIPEVPFDIEGENGFLKHLEKRLLARHHAVIVVAEGAGQDIMESKNATDASGNKRLADIGLHLKEAIERYFKLIDMHINLKYIDPSYQIRSAVAAPIDSIYCERLGNNAVHAAMCGKTKMIVGLVHNKFVHLPIDVVVSQRKYVDPEGSLWRDALDATGQPIVMKNALNFEKKH